MELLSSSRVFALEAGKGLAEGFVFEAGVAISGGPKSSLGFSVLGCECSEFCARSGKNLVGDSGAAVGLGVLTAGVLTTSPRGFDRRETISIAAFR